MEILKLVIDFQFKDTFEFVRYQIFLYVMGYFLPLVIQMKTKELWIIQACNISCLLTTWILFSIELVQISD